MYHVPFLKISKQQGNRRASPQKRLVTVIIREVNVLPKFLTDGHVQDFPKKTKSTFLSTFCPLLTRCTGIFL